MAGPNLDIGAERGGDAGRVFSELTGRIVEAFREADDPPGAAAIYLDHHDPAMPALLNWLHDQGVLRGLQPITDGPVEFLYLDTQDPQYWSGKRGLIRPTLPSWPAAMRVRAKSGHQPSLYFDLTYLQRIESEGILTFAQAFGVRSRGFGGFELFRTVICKHNVTSLPSTAVEKTIVNNCVSKPVGPKDVDEFCGKVADSLTMPL